MLQDTETEREILLGNKQLGGIFLVIAVLLAGAFTAGYMLGRGPAGNKRAVTATTAAAPANSGPTISVPPEPASTTPASETEAPPPETAEQPAAHAQGFQKVSSSTASAASDEFTPQPGQTFLQVAATRREEAEAVADVLSKKGFRAHAVPKPGNPKIYRVLIGPIRDSSDYSNSRDMLRKTGFSDVVRQRY